MSGLAATVIGLAGSAFILGAYGYNVLATAPRPLAYNLTNLLGAGLLTASLLVHFNLAALLLEIAWMAIALVGIGKALARKETLA